MFFDEDAKQTKDEWENLQRERLTKDLMKEKLDELVLVNFEMAKRLRHY